MVKLFIFDLGKVLIDFDFKIAVKKLMPYGKIDPMGIFHLFRNSQLTHNWDKGLVPPEEFFSELKKDLHLSIGMKEFIPIWNDIFTEKKEMIDWALSLRKKYNVVILSNTNIWHVEHLKIESP